MTLMQLNWSWLVLRQMRKASGDLSLYLYMHIRPSEYALACGMCVGPLSYSVCFYHVDA